MGFQNTKMRLKDAATLNASSTLLKADMVIKKNTGTGITRSGEFTLNTNVGNLLVNSAIGQCEALYVKTTAPGGVNSIAGTIVTGPLAGAKVEVEVSNTVTTAAGNATLANASYGLVVQFSAASNTRQIRPTAYMAFGDKQGGLLGGAYVNSVAYLFDLGFAEGTVNTFYVNATATTGVANGAFRNANCSGSNAGSLAIRVNGVEKFIPVYGAVS